MLGCSWDPGFLLHSVVPPKKKVARGLSCWPVSSPAATQDPIIPSTDIGDSDSVVSPMDIAKKFFANGASYSERPS